jgi:predicted nucleotide-binding protein
MEAQSLAAGVEAWAKAVTEAKTYTTDCNVQAFPLHDALPTAFCEKYQQKVQYDHENCIACGRNVSKQNAKGVFVVNGGEGICKAEDVELEQRDAGFMGWFPVGSECIKTVPTEYRADNPYKG